MQVAERAQRAAVLQDHVRRRQMARLQSVEFAKPVWGHSKKPSKRSILFAVTAGVEASEWQITHVDETREILVRDTEGNLHIGLPVTLSPHWAVAELDEADQPWQLLVRIEHAGIDPDTRSQLDEWEATPHQRFERLLRDTGVFAGVMITDKVIRLVYAPRGETSGHL